MRSVEKPARGSGNSKPAQFAFAVLGSAFCLATFSSCASEVGTVELGWQYLDSDADSDNPIDKRCEVPGRRGDTELNFDFETQLIIADAQNCEDESCIVRQVNFTCDRSRGAIRQVPVGDESYWMTVQVEVIQSDGLRFIPSAECVSVPAARRRKVRPGQITDLAVNQFIVRRAAELQDEGSSSLLFDLEGCQEE